MMHNQLNPDGPQITCDGWLTWHARIREGTGYVILGAFTRRGLIRRCRRYFARMRRRDARVAEARRRVRDE